MKQNLRKITALLAGALLLIQLLAIPALAVRSVFVGDISMDNNVGPEDARLALRM